MSMRIRDYAPSIRAAGKHLNMAENQGITQELRDFQAPPTPKNVAPFRKSFQARVGLQSHHWGLRNDKATPDIVHGEANKYESSAEECLKPAASSKGLSALSAENAEKKYNRSRKEPLGKSAEPLYTLPSKTQKENFYFGIATEKSENAKSVIYAGGRDEDAKPDTAAPGKQKNRRYDWARVGIDPTKVRFGRASSADPLTTKELCQPPNPTKILPKIVQDHCAVNNPQQGQCKNLGFGSRNETKDHVYGFSSRRNDMGTRLLIGGSGVEPPADDQDLGRPVCRSVKLRNLKKKDLEARGGEDPNRVFGCPAVRMDLPRPKYRKVTNPNNYGDEPTGGSLLYPNPHAVNEESFLNLMTMSEVRDLFAKTGGCPGATDEQVEQAIQTAFKGKGPEGKVDLLTVNNILDSYNA